MPPNAFLEALPQLGLIACVSVGYERVDVDWCRRHKVALTTGRGANAEDVADHALALVLCCRRRIAWGDAAVRGGAWVNGLPRSHSLRGARVGVICMGAIGQAIARRLAFLGMEVSWWGPRAKPELAFPRAESLLALAAASDVLVMAARADDATRGLLGREVFEALGPEGLLVNIARGSVVDEDALIAALKSGRLGQAALDVFAQEPTPAARWADVPNVLLTPHMAGSTFEATQALWGHAKENLVCFFSGQPLATPLLD